MAMTFGEFSFDPGSGELARGGDPVPLQQQPARVLRYLLEHPDRVIPRDEIVRHIWPGGHYVNFDQGLNYCIRQIRVALGEDAGAPRFLETIPRRGYRWKGEPKKRESGVGSRESEKHLPGALPITGPAPSAALKDRARRVPIWAAAAFVAIGAVLGATLTTNLAPAPIDRTPSTTAGRATVGSHLRMAFDALHLLTHAAIEPERRAEAPRAIATLWFVLASQFGLVFTE